VIFKMRKRTLVCEMRRILGTDIEVQENHLLQITFDVIYKVAEYNFEN